MPDLLINDQMMPRKSGVELLTKLRKPPELRSIPVIFLTARARTEARIESLEAGTDNYLTKPFDTTELLANGSKCTGVYARKISGHLTTGQNSSDFKYS